MGFGANSDGLPSFEGIIGMTGFDLHGRVKFSIAFFLERKAQSIKLSFFSSWLESGENSLGNGL